jgi:hypothetical protein
MNRRTITGIVIIICGLLLGKLIKNVTLGMIIGVFLGLFFMTAIIKK